MEYVPLTELPQRRLSASSNLTLKGLVNRLGQIKYLKPDGLPNNEWRMFYAPTWGEAWRLAKEELNHVDMVQGERNQPYLQNISRSVAVQGCELFGDDFILNVAWAACYTSQEAIKPLVTDWEWNKKLFDEVESVTEKDIVTNKSFGGLTKKVRFTLCNILSELHNDIYNLTNETARDSAIESVGEDAWLLAQLLLTEHHPYFYRRERHIAHAEERLKVWEKGYALAGDICGKLYVYCKGRLPVSDSIENNCRSQNRNL
ncbi:hypothetical protein COU54_03340 [Candidatus Pacearchaeota archaeon CG10_big_fil_rev_8_21_14_0_10_31_24]|nr:MAG: hypothetical protein COU54_03340 [Candidatus Pacearchaeota archaeon CG10_big_fil_rev_8_21_14_0_10_31_24]